MKAWLSLLFAALTVLIACGSGGTSQEADRAVEPAQAVTRYTMEVLGRIAHSRSSYTQGLVYHEGKLYESTGEVGRSSLQRINATTGAVEAVVPVAKFYGEGLGLVADRLVQLTWKDHTAIVYDLKTLARTGAFSYEGEGWGLTYDGSRLIMSDGTARLSFRDPDTFKVLDTVQVTWNGKPLAYLNELEYANGCLYANVWHETFLVAIDPANGKVTGVVDGSPLLAELGPLEPEEVLNGIAWDGVEKVFYITGKNWPYIFKVRFL